MLTIKQYAARHKMSQFQVIKLVNSKKLESIEQNGEVFIVDITSQKTTLISTDNCSISFVKNGKITAMFVILHVEGEMLKLESDGLLELIGKEAALCVILKNEKFIYYGKLDSNLYFIKN